MTADKQHEKILIYSIVFFGLLSFVAFLALRQHIESALLISPQESSANPTRVLVNSLFSN